MMTRTEVLAAYKVTSNGIIQSPGKFEAEMLYVPAMWKSCLDGDALFDEAGIYGTIFDDADRKEFPEIGTAFGILLEETETGFVYTREFETREEYYSAIDAIEAQAEDEEEDD